MWRSDRKAAPSWRTVGLWLLQLLVLGSGRLENRHIGIGIFPCGEEILICSLRLCRVSLERIGAPQAQVSQRIKHGRGINPAVVENFLILGSSLTAIMRAQKRFATHIVGKIP